MTDQMIKAAVMQAQLAAQIASVSQILNKVNSKTNKADKKSTYRPLLLDEYGREIDESGKLIQTNAPVKTLAANVAEKKKKDNPYLNHNNSNDLSTNIIDERITLSNREQKLKKSLKFIEAGTYVQQAEIIRAKEERKIIAGYSSGRKAPEIVEEDVTPVAITNPIDSSLPPPIDGGVVPSMEWWDEMFLPKDIKINRKNSKFESEKDDYINLKLSYCKTYKYIQHIPVIKPLGINDHNEETKVILPMYLTKKERKRIRKQTRALREQEKRDKLMLGLIKPPENKLKLTNFMKVLGDVAISDPSKIELKVIEQMKKRQLNHEMRNQSAKLTPKERKLKKMKKMQEDTSRIVYTAVFRIGDFNNPKHKFKVDVNAQQRFLSGTVILCPEGDCNIVIVEGGPKGIRKFINLMLNRINWSEAIQSNPLTSSSKNESSSLALPPGILPPSSILPSIEEKEEDKEDDDSDSESEDEKENDHNEENFDDIENKKVKGCSLVWQGTIPKRIFTGFRFQECRSYVAVKKLLESRNLAHYWDLAIQTSLISNN